MQHKLLRPKTPCKQAAQGTQFDRLSPATRRLSTYKKQLINESYYNHRLYGRHAPDSPRNETWQR